MADDLPVDVLTELGRVTWAAIRLEDYAKDVCSSADPRDPRGDMRQIGQRIRDAKRVLAARPPSAVRDEAMAWLDRAREAIERRNAALHATPVVRVGQGSPGEWPQLLGEMPRKGRRCFERPLTAESSADG